MNVLEDQGVPKAVDQDRPLEEPARDVEAEVDGEIQRTVPAAFAVQDVQTATWLVRRIVAAREYKARVKRWAEAEERRAEHEEQRLFYLFGGQLRQWAAAEVEKLNGRRKSVALPGGVIGFRNVPSRIVIRDEVLVMAWARRNCPAAIVTTEKLLKTPVIEHAQSTGELPQGVEIVAPSTEFFVK